MPIELPNLDDRRFTDLVDEGRNMIPGLAPSWTDHNLSDPGITLIELFASVSEQLMYRANRVTAEHKKVFLQLLDPATRNQAIPAQHIDETLATAVRNVRTETRAITASDYERLAGAVQGVQSARCLPRTKVVMKEGASTLEKATGHVTLIILSSTDAAERANEQVRKNLQGYTALTTNCYTGKASDEQNNRATLHVLSARPLTVTVSVKLACFADYCTDKGKLACEAVVKALEDRFHCVKGQDSFRGWPPGTALYKSMLYAVITRVTGVDCVPELTFTVDNSDRYELPEDATGAKPDACIGIVPAPEEYIELQLRCALS